MSQQIKYKIIKDFLGGEGLVKEPINNQYDLIKLTRQGLSKKQLLFLAKKLSLSLNEISKILPLSIRTLQRYRKDHILNPDVSDQIILIAELYSIGLNVFGELEKFSKWLRNPNTALSNHCPIDLIDTSFGIELIKDELGRIQHGVFS